uniref:Chitin-binding type-2 domain-containing protein n=1 Tax=Heliothis virescens TaxID=7102 RepID=A0A2A4JQW1_HELVI
MFQVWHYCDLNGGQASFLCPNGTIFSQAGLTCDWWFNVRCASTTQLYVLNESLYKYILPHSPKFPEDYSGPLVDKYLSLKFKEMEEQFKKNKNKQSASEKTDSDEEESDDSSESSTETEDSSEEKISEPSKAGEGAVSEASVVVGSPGESGKVERLQD